MDIQVQAALAKEFKSLHESDQILVLPNVWDVASARIAEEAGAPAIATSSAGVAFSLGYRDGERIPCREMVDWIGRIARAVHVPVTADFESGYGRTVSAVTENVRTVIQAGAVGINFEDGMHEEVRRLEDLTVQVEKIKAIRSLSEKEGVPLVINARTDVFLDQIGAPESRLDEAVRRSNAYRAAGADCLFVPGVIDGETIGRLTKAIHGPVNILAGPGAPSIAELARLGVARVSVGSKPFCAAMGHYQRVAKELLKEGTYLSLESPITHSSMTQLLTPAIS
ncbi:MAG: isocitrate lyase/phosphoenolpyruvate mutase family protein [Acidobacteriia bacterium]|nr:isocitrate lyase/phosphoenolpyruvate mutase family protein [Terriglobia bacterium]